ncbi:ribonucleotide reductase inhibitor-domain-containing protein [Sordaria brevicollis]|uniref:Ribonucleotide reductase inhibitor-domain-containing protein n=1 Tax=Sordaria brevicollis TaxID=83679 RepID=A0AAE0U9I6_SORBR|nr:ribonucleotide reductase inhibitor-domain-containing protein [Sordaria brevicollis]
MSNSRTKRQFAGAASDPAQRSITSFFKTTPTDDDSQIDSTIAVTSSSKTAAPLNGPVLPPTIRSSLLNVGMRVRKSVPEGYKTGKIASGFPSWMEDSSNNNSASNTTSGSNNGVGHNRPVSAAPPLPLPTVNRELTPFCGIHKIGGYAVQDEGVNINSSAYSSQDSNASSTISNNTGVPSSLHFATQDTNRKRIHEDGSSEEGGAGLFGEDMDWRRREQFPEHQYEEEENRAPRSLEPMAWCGGGNKTNTIAHNDNRRVMAVPKRRGSQFTQTTITSFGGYVPQSSGLVPADDFEEAPFLDYSGLSHRGGRSGDMDMD